VSERLVSLGERIDRVMRGPRAIESQLLFRVARPVLAIAGWRASIRVDALSSLLALLRERMTQEGEVVGGAAKAAGAALEASRSALDAAIRELEANVTAIERVAIVRKRSPIAHAAWLRRVHGVLSLAEAAIEAASAGEPDPEVARVVAQADTSALLPPLVPLREGASGLEVPTEDHPDVEDARLVDLELAAIDHLLAAARAETMMLGRRRRLLVAARQRILEASAALPLERKGVRDRAGWIASEIARIDRLEGAGLSCDVSLLHQARQALVRRDPRRLHAALSALDRNALAAGDRAVSSRTGRALANVWGAAAAFDRAEAARESLDRSAAELLGDVAEEVKKAVASVQLAAQQRLTLGATPSEREGAEELLEYLPEGSDVEILRAAIAADGVFEVGGALSPVRVEEEERVLRIVRHPTPYLVLMPAESVEDLPSAVINDPRSILLDLAAGRLFARRFVKEEVRRRSRVVMRSEVRVYVLDGSGSMRGPRARVRDAILVAELATLIRRLESPGDTRCTLLYRYFHEDPGIVTRVGTVAAAREAIRDVVTTERSGGTDIDKALRASLAQIDLARRADPDLARAHIVLVTDGESPIDEVAIINERAAIEVPIGISVIALGQENPVLRGIVARQRAQGEAAFYHFIDDDQLRAICDGTFTGELAIHPPGRWTELEKDPAALARALEDEVGDLLEELEQLDRDRDVAALERLEDELRARREVGLPEDAGEGDGERARIEALRRDRVALAARFERWFPEPNPSSGAPAPPLPRPGTKERDDVDATCCALASVCEIVELLGGSRLARQADAIELLERLLPDAQLSPARYRAVLREFPHAVAPSLQAVRAAVLGRKAAR